MSAVLMGNFRSMSPLDQSARERANFAISSRYSHIVEPEAVYEVVTVTNFNGLAIPTSFTFTQYAFIVGNGTIEKKLSTVTIAKAAVIEAIELVDPFPKISGEVKNVNVADYRFFDPSNRIGYVGYVATNSAWLTDRLDPYLQKLYSDAKARSASESSFVISKRWKVSFLFLLVISWPLFLPSVRTRIRRALNQQASSAK